MVGMVDLVAEERVIEVPAGVAVELGTAEFKVREVVVAVGDKVGSLGLSQSWPESSEPP